MRNKVDLPAPLGPMTVTISRAATARSTWSSTVRRPKRLVMPLA
jgi:hypothetical protein